MTSNQEIYGYTNSDGIFVHNKDCYDAMRKSGQLAASILDAMYDYVVPGITTQELNDICHKMIIDAGAIPAPLNYKGFPKSICTSVNHVVCHGIPSDKKLKEGDSVNIDVTTILDGWFGDTSRMYWVGKKIPIITQLLTKVTYECLMKGIEMVKPGVTFGDIGWVIQQHAEKNNFSVVRDYCGHGLGRVFHAPPNVLHYGNRGEGEVLEEGMFFTIEPMINAGKKGTIMQKDNWTVTTKDKSLSCQFEHSLAVTEDGCEIFTESVKSLCSPHLFVS